MKYYLQAKEKCRIYRPVELSFEKGEERKVGKSVYDAHYDSDIFESWTENQDEEASEEEADK